MSANNRPACSYTAHYRVTCTDIWFTAACPNLPTHAVLEQYRHNGASAWRRAQDMGEYLYACDECAAQIDLTASGLRLVRLMREA